MKATLKKAPHDADRIRVGDVILHRDIPVEVPKKVVDSLQALDGVEIEVSESADKSARSQ